MSSADLKQQIDQQIDLIKRGTLEIIQESELRAKIERSLTQKKPLIIKMGFDPTAPDLHLGHSIGIRKLRDFQDLGHEVHFLIGDFTARIGDPTGRNKTRPPLTSEEIVQNAKTYQEQVFKILDPKKTKVVFNSEWCSKLKPEQMIEIAAQMTVARVLEREDFKKRYTQGTTISIHEFLYPLIQGYDSVAMRADVELGGQDQRFNLLVGRDLQKFYGQECQVLVFLPLLEGTDGVEKLSKSYGNHIGIMEEPKQMFEKVLNIPDSIMPKYFELCTRVPVKDYQSWIAADPREAKYKLAFEITKFYSSEEAAKTAEMQCRKVSSGNHDEIEAEVIELPSEAENLAKYLGSTVKLVPSNAEARRLLDQGGVSLNVGSDSRTLNSSMTTKDLEGGGLLKVGKKIRRRIHPKK